MTWRDAWFETEQQGPAPERGDYLVRTVGFLVSEGRFVSLAQEVLPDGDGFRAVTHVPRELVQGPVIRLEEVGT